MEAVIITGGKQYLVKEGQVLDVEKIEGEPSKEIVFDEVLLVLEGKDKLKIGKPFVKNAKVKAQIIEQKKAKKVISFRYTRREQYKRKKGHRQRLTRVKITGIKV